MKQKKLRGSRRLRESRKHQARVTSDVQVLESRLMLNADVTLNLDFTPDIETPDIFPVGDFGQIFSTQHWDTHVQNFPLPNPVSTPVLHQRLLQILDFNEDGKLDEKDAKGDPTADTVFGRIGAERAIAASVLQDFQPVIDSMPVTEVSVRRVDDGWARLMASENNNAESTYVMFVGSFHPEDKLNQYGVAFQAAPGRNAEYYGYIYAENMVRRMIRETGPTPNSQWSPRHFVNFVTSSTSHEFGHQLGLGHVLQQSATGNSFVASTATDHLMSYGRVRWNNTATFPNDTRPFVEIRGMPTPNTQNAFIELRNSLGINGGQTTVAVIAQDPDPSFHDSGELVDFGFEPPVRNLPVASTGTVGGTTAADIADSLATGIADVKSILASEVAAQLNLTGVELPFADSALGDLFGLNQAIANVITNVDISGVTTMTDLMGSVEAAGFVIENAVTEAELTNLRNNFSSSAADFLQASQSFRLLELAGATSLDQSVLSALGDLSGVNFTGDLSALANVAIHLTIGVDSGGFYVAPGLLLDAPINLSGQVSANLGTFGNVEGLATLDLRGKIDLTTSAADGRIRSSDFMSATLPAEIRGVAGADFSFTANIGSGLQIDFGGNWVWDVDQTGFNLNSGVSGFDTNMLRDSVAEIVSDAVDGFIDAADDFGNIAERIPVVGEALSSRVIDSIQKAISLGNNDLTFVERFEAAGFNFDLAPGLTARSFVDGSYINLTNLVEVTYDKTFTPDIDPFTFSGALDVSANISGELTGTFDINGDASTTADDASLRLSLGLGIDVVNGPYLVEGSFIELDVSPTASLTGELSLGDLVNIRAMANAGFELTTRLSFDNFDQTLNNYYVSHSDSSSLTDLAQSTSSLTQIGSADFALTLSTDNPVASIPFLGIGDAIKEALSSPTNPNGDLKWEAAAHFVFTTSGAGAGFEIASSYDITSTDDYLTNLFSGVAEKLFEKSFLGQIEKANPFPKEFRKLVTTKIPFIGDKSLAELTGLDALNILLSEDPSSEIDDSSEVDGDADGGPVDVHFDILEVSNIQALLSGERADLISLIVDQDYPLGNFEIPLIEESLLYSFFGVINVTGSLDLTGDLAFGVDFTTTLDTKGLYIHEQTDVLSITGGISIVPTLRGRLTVVEFAKIEGSIGVELVGSIGYTGKPADEPGVRNFVPNIFTIESYLNFSIDGTVGFPDINLTKSFDIYDERLLLFKQSFQTSSLDQNDNGFPEARRKMEEELNKLGLCATGVAASAFVPGVGAGVAVVACGIAYSDQIQQAIEDAGRWVSTEWENLQDSVANASEEVQDWANERAKVADEGLKQFDEEVLRPVVQALESIPVLGDAIKSLGKTAVEIRDGVYGKVNNVVKSFGEVVSGYQERKRDEALNPVKQSFSTELVNGVLTIRYAGDPLKGDFVGVPNTLDLGISKDDKDKFLIIQAGRVNSAGEFVNQTFSGPEVVKRVIKERRDWDKGEFTWKSWVQQSVDEVIDSNFVHQNLQAFELSQVSRIVVYGTDLGDSILASGKLSIPLEIHGNDGDDILSGGSGNDYIEGGDGEDRIDGGGGDDTIDGGNNDDRISGGTGNDLIRGGRGADVIDESPGEGNRSGEINTIYGGMGSDIIQGSPGKDIVFGESGNDQIRGGAGDDELDGGTGSDLIEGQDGNDGIWGRGGNDLLLGGNSNDTISGGSGDDEIHGNSGDDNLSGEDGSDRILGGSGEDAISGNGGGDILYGGGGDDLIYGASEGSPDDPSDGNDVIYGDGGNDTIHAGLGGHGLPNLPEGGENRNYIDGGSGADTITGSDGPDYIKSGSGNDFVIARGGDDIVLGDSGSDFIDAGSGDDTVQAGVDAKTGIGSTILGGLGDDLIIGSSGLDTIFGEADDDLIHGGFQRDVIYGNGGEDDLHGNEGDDDIFGGDGNDQLFPGIGKNLIEGNSGDDRFYLGRGEDNAFGQSGQDRFFVENPTTGDPVRGTVKIDGGSDDDELHNTDLDSDWAIDDVYGGAIDSTNTRFSNVEDLFGGERRDAFVFSGYGLVDNIDGGNGNDKLDFTVNDSQDVTLKGLGLLDGFWGVVASGIIQEQFTNVNEIYGSESGIADRLTGIDATAFWTVNSGVPLYRYRSTNQLDFSQFEILNGGSKVDTYNMFATAFEMTLNGNGGNDLFDFLGGDLDGYAKVNITGGSDDGGDAKTRDRVVVDDQSGNTDEPFDYRLEPHSLTNSVDDPSNPDPADTNPPAPPRTFGGIFFDMDVEYLELEGTDGANRFSVRPSPYTVFHVDGNDPSFEDCTLGGGDFLQLDLSKLPPVDDTVVANPMILFTKLDEKGRQREGVWFFDPPHKDVEFENIERFNLLDKVLVSDDAGEDSVPEIDVVSAVTLTSYSNLVKNFSPDPIVAFNVYDFGQAQPSNFTYLAGMRYVAANVNNDDRVDSEDVLIVIENLGLRHGTFDVRADVNFDGKVNKLDLLAVLERQGKEILERPVVGGVRTVAADLNCDGIDDIIAVSGANHVPTIQAFNGVTGQPMTAPQQLGDPSNQFGVYVAAGDFDGDGHVELTTSMERESERVTVWEFVDDHFEFSHDFSSGFGNDAISGVRVSSGDIDGDFIDEIIVSPGTGRDPEVRVFDGLGLQLQQISVSSDYGRGGLSTLAADLNGDGMDEILVLAGRRGGSLVSFVPGTDPVAIQVPAPLLDALVTSADNLSPLSGVGRDMDGDGDDEFFFGQLSDGRSGKVQVFDWDEAVQELFFKDEFETDSNWTGDFLG